MAEMTPTYYRICPYCGTKRRSGSNSLYYIKKYHPGKPLPSDEDFPGWGEKLNDNKTLLF